MDRKQSPVFFRGFWFKGRAPNFFGRCSMEVPPCQGLRPPFVHSSKFVNSFLCALALRCAPKEGFVPPMGFRVMPRTSPCVSLLPMVPTWLPVVASVVWSRSGHGFHLINSFSVWPHAELYGKKPAACAGAGFRHRRTSSATELCSWRLTRLGS